MVPPVRATALLACVAMVPRPKFVRAADAVVALVPPLPTAMGVATLTVGAPSSFRLAAVTSTPVANVNPLVTLPLIATQAISLTMFMPTPDASTKQWRMVGRPTVTSISRLAE